MGFMVGFVIKMEGTLCTPFKVSVKTASASFFVLLV